MIKFQSEKEGITLTVGDGLAYLTIHGLEEDPATEQPYLTIRHIPAVRKKELDAQDNKLLKAFKESRGFTSGGCTKDQKTWVRNFKEVLFRGDLELAHKIIGGEADVDQIHRQYACYDIQGSIFGIDHGKISSAAMFKKLRALGFCISPTMLRHAIEQQQQPTKEKSA